MAPKSTAKIGKIRKFLGVFKKDGVFDNLSISLLSHKMVFYKREN